MGLAPGGRDGHPTLRTRVMWYVVDMSHDFGYSHAEFGIKLGDRGRLVLPAELRRAMGVNTGDELVARLEGDGVHLISRRQLARRARGLLRESLPGRDLVAELWAERRSEGEQE
jgi:bifunctional DNA-binding transcriptional regulator/antitoxin component of YhaV-PrlF toxin-antitoxin module